MRDVNATMGCNMITDLHTRLIAHDGLWLDPLTRGLDWPGLCFALCSCMSLVNFYIIYSGVLLLLPLISPEVGLFLWGSLLATLGALLVREDTLGALVVREATLGTLLVLEATLAMLVALDACETSLCTTIRAGCDDAARTSSADFATWWDTQLYKVIKCQNLLEQFPLRPNTIVAQALSDDIKMLFWLPMRPWRGVQCLSSPSNTCLNMNIWKSVLNPEVISDSAVLYWINQTSQHSDFLR